MRRSRSAKRGSELRGSELRFPGAAHSNYFCEIGTPAGAWAFSALRAPTMMFTASLLFSLQSYSNNGPGTELKGTMAVQGFVQVEGSSTVKEYSIVSLSTRLKRSVIFKVFGLALR